jgi:glycosyltransferase involved in cell wall biosynthesis
MTRVLHVITGLAAGGAEQQLRLLVRHLPVESDVLTLTNAGTVATTMRAEGTRVVDLGMGGNRDLSALPPLVSRIRRGRYDLVHTHLFRAGLYGRLAARAAGVPSVATEHSLGHTTIEGRPLTPAVRALYRVGERLGRATIAVSDPVADRLAAWGVRRERITVIPNGIAAGDFRFDPLLRDRTRAALGLGPADRVIGAVGRLDTGKRFDVLIRALSGLDATLLLVGDGPQRAALVLLAAAAGVGDRVRFAGEVHDIRPLLCAMDVLASPSAEETFGLAVLEGLAAGLPVCYSSCPALEALPARAAPRARVVSPHEVPMHWELARALRDPGRREPPPAVDHYRIDRLAGRVAELYQQVLEGREFRWQLQPNSSGGS